MFCMDASWIIRSLTTVMDCGTSRSSVSVFVALRVRAGAYVSSASCVSADTDLWQRRFGVGIRCGLRIRGHAASPSAARAGEASAKAVITAKAMGFTAERVERVCPIESGQRITHGGSPLGVPKS